MIPAVEEGERDTHARFLSNQGVDGSDTIAVIEGGEKVDDDVKLCDFINGRDDNLYGTMDLREAPDELRKAANFWMDFSVQDDLGVENYEDIDEEATGERRENLLRGYSRVRAMGG